MGSNEARNLGPWSSAVELVNARQQAQAEREDRIKAGGSAAAQDEEEGECMHISPIKAWSVVYELERQIRRRSDVHMTFCEWCI